MKDDIARWAKQLNFSEKEVTDAVYATGISVLKQMQPFVSKKIPTEIASILKLFQVITQPVPEPKEEVPIPFVAKGMWKLPVAEKAILKFMLKSRRQKFKQYHIADSKTVLNKIGNPTRGTKQAVRQVKGLLTNLKIKGLINSQLNNPRNNRESPDWFLTEKGLETLSTME